jgi:hypothetical protein
MALSFDYAYFCVLHGVCGSQQSPASALMPAHEPPGMLSPSICARWDEVLMQFQDARERRARDVAQEIASDGSLTPCDLPTWRMQCAGQVIENTTMTLVYGKTQDGIYYSSVCDYCPSVPSSAMPPTGATTVFNGLLHSVNEVQYYLHHNSLDQDNRSTPCPATIPSLQPRPKRYCSLSTSCIREAAILLHFRPTGRAYHDLFLSLYTWS